ncbi:MAG: hypothetical protein GY937_25520 [bacterium]|nr:hypothetical protein [bacterium]
MPLADLHVNELVLRVPGLTRAEGVRLGTLVEERLAARAAIGRFPSHAGRLEVDVNLPTAQPLDQLAEQIVLRLSVQLGLEA